MNRQIRLVGAGIIILFVAVFVKLNYLQLVHAKALNNSPTNGTKVVNEFDKPRGAIISSDGVTLAQSVAAPKGSSFAYQRLYPTGPLFADVTGYYSFIYGADGAEKTYNDLLTGAVQKSGFPTNLTDLQQLLTEKSSAQNITLTVNDKLQQVARTGLAGRDGSVVALDPSTGAILAMYSNPSYNPESLSQLSTVAEEKAWKQLLADPGNPLSPGAYRNIWPPGSSFKVVTSSAVYDRKPSLANKTFPQLSGLPLPQTSHLLHNFAGEVCGGQILELFTVSCDTGFGKIGLDLGAHNLYNEATQFGFDAVPPIDLPGAAASVFPKPSTFVANRPTLAYSAIGQEDVAASPLEMAMVVGAIADHGTMMTPHILASVSNSQGRVVSHYTDKVWKHATSPATAAKVTTLMESVVNSPNGTGVAAAIPGVEVAAKTGTAETGSPPTHTDDWFVCFAPAAHPTIAVAVMLPNQGIAVNDQGGTLAAPIAKAVMEEWLKLHPVKDPGKAVHANTGSGAAGSTQTSGSSGTSTTTTVASVPSSTTVAPSTTTVPASSTTTTPASTTTSSTTVPASSTTTAPATSTTTSGSPPSSTTSPSSAAATRSRGSTP